MNTYSNINMQHHNLNDVSTFSKTTSLTCFFFTDNELWNNRSRANCTAIVFFFFSCGNSRGEIFHFGNEKVIKPWPKDHNTEVWVLTVTERLGKPLYLRHLAKYSPLLSELYKKWLPFSPLLPTTYNFKLIYTEEKNTTEETGNTPLCHREGKFAFLFI